LAPQHETSCDAEITTKRRLGLLEKNNWREQLRSLPTTSRKTKRSWKL